ncbi:hypothetical protein Cri9333_0722 [Crinalium epipsammum PCC 9333]|uniref:Uncharacterized protein n=1 Tax=Crinalium epipsammum PCC 9333 TaxID=1173022 RepID=K9VWW4_9CYAN|nr:hypothetical protein Cri9333_0722 [Crinalium epipsammum PCC 9333]
MNPLVTQIVHKLLQKVLQVLNFTQVNQIVLLSLAFVLTYLAET